MWKVGRNTRNLETTIKLSNSKSITKPDLRILSSNFLVGLSKETLRKKKYYQILRLILIQTYYMQVPKRPVCKKHFRNSSEKFLYVAAPFMFCKVKLVKVNWSCDIANQLCMWFDQKVEIKFIFWNVTNKVNKRALARI